MIERNTFNVHEQYKNMTLDELKQVSSDDRLPFAVMLLNIEYDLNQGNIVRSAHITGAEHVIILGNSKFDSRGCVGAQNYLRLDKYKVDVGETLLGSFTEILDINNYHPVFIEKTNISNSINTPEFKNSLYGKTKKPCLVFGNESLGIPEELMRYSKNVYHIPQRGVIRSFNVASAAAIVLYATSQILLEKIHEFNR